MCDNILGYHHYGGGGGGEMVVSVAGTKVARCPAVRHRHSPAPNAENVLMVMCYILTHP